MKRYSPGKIHRKMQRDKDAMARIAIERRLEARKKAIMAEFNKAFKRSVDVWVPTWVKKLSLMIPPGIYQRIVHHILNAKKLREFVENIKKKEWSNKRKLLNIYIAVFFYRIMLFIVLDWMHPIRRFVRTIGISVIIFESRSGHLKQIIKYWGKKVYEKEVDVGV